MTNLDNCPFCDGPVQFRKALWPSDGCTDAIIHAEPTTCGLFVFSDGTADESILTKWNTRAARPAPMRGDLVLRVLLGEAFSSRAPDYVEVNFPGWTERVKAALLTQTGDQGGGK